MTFLSGPANVRRRNALSAGAPIPASALDLLERWLSDADPWVPFRMRPLEFAAHHGLAPRNAVELFLRATAAGLTTMQWDILCRGCGDVLESATRLDRLAQHGVCTLCQIDTEPSLEDHMEVTFTVHPDLRVIPAHHPETLSPEDYYFRFHYDPRPRADGSPGPAEHLRRYVRHLQLVPPGGETGMEADLPRGWLEACDRRNRSGFILDLRDMPPAERTETRTLVPDRAEPPEGAAPGRIRLRIRNGSPRPAALLTVFFPGDEALPPLNHTGHLTGKAVLTHPAFHELFARETLPVGQSLSVRDLTVLFTDLTGSTALYERLGDLKAFALVQEHFTILATAAARHNGTVVKTIGDAVMAAFPEPADGVRAARDMMAGMRRFNEARGTHDLLLKIGLHRGPALALTLNGRMDYFGHTVNVAARAQAAAGAGSVALTDEVRLEPAARALLEPDELTVRRVHVKGVEAGLNLHSWTPAGL